MWPFKKELLIKAQPFEAYKFTPGGLYIIEASKQYMTLKQAHDIQRKGRELGINIKVVLTEGDRIALSPLRASDFKK